MEGLACHARKILLDLVATEEFKQDSISFREKQTSVQKYNCGNRSVNGLEMGKELK